MKKSFKPENLIYLLMIIKQINPAVFEKLSLEFQTYIEAKEIIKNNLNNSKEEIK